MNLRLGVFILCASLLNACGAEKHTSGIHRREVVSPPEWVSQRPNDISSFIGIGSCNKKTQPLEFQSIAKKNALNDLATEISVRVQGATIMNTQEKNKSFSEDFLSSVKTTTDEKIEDFEVAGVWENDHEYWVFYRLNKERYYSKRRDKKRQALSSGYDYLEKGSSAAESGNIASAFDLYMHGLFAIKEYWTEPNEMESPMGKIFLDNEIMKAMQTLFESLRFEVGADKVMLDSKNKFRDELIVKVKSGDNAARSLAVIYEYEQESFMKPKTQFTSELGEVRITVEKVSPKSNTNQLRISVDPELFLAEDLDKPLQRSLLKGIRGQQVVVPIIFVPPTFYMSVNDNGNNTLSLKNTVMSEIQKRGFRTSAIEKESNYSVSVQSILKPGGKSDDFVFAFVDLTVELRENISGEIRYAEVLNGIKGVGINELGATNDAFKKAGVKLEQQIIPIMLQRIF